MSSEAARSCADALVVELGKEYSGVKLSPVMIETVVKYLVDVVKVKDIDEVDLGDLLEHATEAWGDTNEGSELPGLHGKRIKLWCTKRKAKPGLSSALSFKGEDE